MAPTRSFIVASAAAGTPRRRSPRTQYVDTIGDLEDLGHVVTNQHHGRAMIRTLVISSRTRRRWANPKDAVGSSMNRYVPRVCYGPYHRDTLPLTSGE